MNVLLLAPTPPPTGGIARWTETVIDYCNRNNEINIFHINTGNQVEAIVRRTAYQRFIVSSFRVIQICKNAEKLCKDNSIAVAHITTSGGFGMVRDYALIRALKKRGVKVVYHLHFGRVPYICEHATFEYKMLDHIMRMTDTVITMDPKTQNIINKSIKSAFVPNPIKEVAYCYSNKHRIVFVGYVVKDKGIVELCRAWKNMYTQYPDWHIDIIGPYETSFLNELKSEIIPSSISFVGELPHEEVMKFVQKASILVLPSYSEGFPYSICEAMFAGKAIIGSSVGAIPFLLDNECGVLCKERSVESLQTAIKLLIDNEALRKKYGRNAAEKAKKTFTVEKVMEQYKGIWEEVAAELQ